jgi:hypothetical protein
MNDTDVERTAVLGFKITKCFDLQRFVFLIVVKLTEEIIELTDGYTLITVYI